MLGLWEVVFSAHGRKGVSEVLPPYSPPRSQTPFTNMLSSGAEGRDVKRTSAEVLRGAGVWGLFGVFLFLFYC